jgi:DNA-binding transcriptional MerR regulator
MTTAELAERAGTTKRTIRYYLAEGLLPPAGGTSTRLEFDREHELTLRLIQHLQAAGVKLGAVKGILGRYSPEDIEGLVDAFDRGEHPSVGEQGDELPAATDIVRHAPLSLLYGAIPDASPVAEKGAVQTEARGRPVSPGATGSAASGESADLWRRIRLAEEVEMLVRAPLDPHRGAAVQEVVAYGLERLGFRGPAKEPSESVDPAPPYPSSGGASVDQPTTPKADEEAP